MAKVLEEGFEFSEGTAPRTRYPYKLIIEAGEQGKPVVLVRGEDFPEDKNIDALVVYLRTQFKKRNKQLQVEAISDDELVVQAY